MNRKTIGVNTAIFNDRGQILLVKHSYGRKGWHLPGGGAEPDESIQDTAVRETYEETGLRVIAMSLSGIYYDPGQDCLVFVVLCRPQNGKLDTLRPDYDEVSDCDFWSIDEPPKPISDFTINRIHDAVSGKTWPLPAVITPRQWFE